MPFSRIASLIVALALLAAACGNDTATEPAATPDVTTPCSEAPSSDNVFGIAYETFDGEPARLDDHLGTPLVINFFAQWCVNCVQEMPDFQEVSKEFAGEVDFVGLSIDKGAAEALELIDATGVTYPTGWDPTEEIYAHFRGLSMPTTVFVDADVQIQRVWSGALDADAPRDKISEEIL
jgi:thiol-disulfide isomerase/thioredoxin